MPKSKRVPVIEVVTIGRSHWWRVVGANGQTFAVSETYRSRSNALRAAKRLKSIVADAVIKEK